jgi:hypothetical protein
LRLFQEIDKFALTLGKAGVDSFTDYPKIEEDAAQCATLKEALAILKTAIYCQEEKLPAMFCDIHDATTS